MVWCISISLSLPCHLFNHSGINTFSINCILREPPQYLPIEDRHVTQVCWEGRERRGRGEREKRGGIMRHEEYWLPSNKWFMEDAGTREWYNWLIYQAGGLTIQVFREVAKRRSFQVTSYYFPPSSPSPIQNEEPKCNLNVINFSH